MISVIVPVYNVEKYLHRCVDSIINQTYKDLEIILIDDGSTDNSGKICDEYQKSDERIRVIHKNNGGLSDARNKGLDIAKGEYIGFVDSDDCIDEKMYEILYKTLIDTNSDISICNLMSFTEIIQPQYNPTYDKKIISEKTQLNMITSFDTKDIVVWNKLYKKNIFHSLRFETGRMHEDQWILPYIVLASKQMVYIDTTLYYYYTNNESISKKTLSEKRAFDLIEGLENTCSVLKEKGMQDYQKKMVKHTSNNIMNLYNELKPSLNKRIKSRFKDNYKKFINDNKDVISKKQIGLFLFLLNMDIGAYVYKLRSN